MKRSLLIIVIGTLLGGSVLFSNSKMHLTTLPKAEDKMTIETEDYPDFEEDAYFTKEEDQSNQFAADLISYLEKLLRTGNVEKGLKKISANYAVLNEKETKKILKRDTNGDLDNYRKTTGQKKDKWYKVNFSDNGNDIVIKHPAEEGKEILVYYFPQWNNKGVYGPALRAKGNGNVYFINWNNSNYMVISQWDKKRKHIKGMTVYNYSGPLIGVLMSIEINDTGKTGISYYSYFISGTGQQPEGAAYWP